MSLKNIVVVFVENIFDFVVVVEFSSILLVQKKFGFVVVLELKDIYIRFGIGFDFGFGIGKFRKKFGIWLKFFCFLFQKV